VLFQGKIVDVERLGTELLRYGLQVAVVALPAPRELKTTVAWQVVGPCAFGCDLEFQPLPGETGKS
jgi:hypothetical protein